MATYDDVYGISYQKASTTMDLLAMSIQQRLQVGPFSSIEELEEWVHNHLLDKIVYMLTSKKFFYMSHKGEILDKNSYEMYYGELLQYVDPLSEKQSIKHWIPEGFKYLSSAYIAAETTDGVHKPLFFRNYSIPTGYYSFERDAFNVARPFKVFARETGRDTSHIYKYLQHLGGECYMWLLAWLRAKMINPTMKTQVVPVIVSRAQGSGKTTFAEVICKGLFGKENVIVSDQYDATARFNSDYADALIVCQEEKEETDKRNPAGTLKSRATATTIRKEQKGVDPIYQESYTDFIMTTNKDVPIKFDGPEDQRRFMVIEADGNFTRKLSEEADEVFTKLYGYDATMTQHGIPFVEDEELIAQFKHELYTSEEIAAVELRNFPKTSAYKRCFTLPQTSEASEIDSITMSIAPFILATLKEGRLVDILDDGTRLTDIIQSPEAIEYMPSINGSKAYVAICRPLIYYAIDTNRAFAHSTVERSLYNTEQAIAEQFGLYLIHDMTPIPGGFTKVLGRYKNAPAARFTLEPEVFRQPTNLYMPKVPSGLEAKLIRKGKRLRVNDQFLLDENGCYETVNELKEGVINLKNKSQNVEYLDTFLLESDTPLGMQANFEKQIAESWKANHEPTEPIDAAVLYKDRLEIAYKESMRLYAAGIVARVVYSGAKSYHLLIRVADAPSNIDEYNWLHSYLCNQVSTVLTFDESTSDPARLTRSPLKLRRVSSAYDLVVTGTQDLVCENWAHVYNIQWRVIYDQWLQRPKAKYETKGKIMVPTRPEYKEAVAAIVNQTFWSDSKWDGKRQKCFFPAYRLLRLIGYTHQELWSDVIPMGVRMYKKQDERGYWLTRESSELIEQIDASVDNYNEGVENV